MILFLLPYQKLHAQSTKEIAVERLRAEGFEEIRILQEGTNVICTIERGLYRTPAEDFRNALNQLGAIYPDTCQFQIILLEQGQPVYQLSGHIEKRNNVQPTNANSSEPAFKGEITYYDEKTYQKVKKEPVNRPVSSGITMVIFPQLTFRNMLLKQIYERQINLAPAIQYSGWKGMTFTGQVIFPLFNELGYIYDFIRPGFLTLSQNISLPGLNSLKFTVGNFNNDSYGFDLKWKKHFKNSRWNLSANAGLTGRTYIYDLYWNHGPVNRFSWNVKAGYYLPKYQMQADLQLGQFLVKDQGFRFDVYRHFGEATIGAWVVSSGGKHNGGFHFAFPLDLFKRKHNNRIRVMLPNTFDNEYYARNDFVYGNYYETRPDENRSVQDLPPQFINNIFFNP